MSYLIHDAETTIKKSYKRTANPFDPENWVVANGFKRKGEEIFCDYHLQPGQQRMPIQERDKILVGFNYKFDLLYHWHLPKLQAFFKRGGRVWCCQYAEYLLEGQVPESHMLSMDAVVEKYGGHLKIDEVKAMWKAGINTPDIPKDLLLRYLGGAEGDIANTEIIYLAQVARARKSGQLLDILQRMDGLLATTEMEYNGLYIDKVQAYEDKAMLEGELDVLQEKLEKELPDDLPFEFNWGSGTHKSCLLFGGTVKYEKFKQHKEEGKLLWIQKKEKWALLGGEPYMPFRQVDTSPACTNLDRYLGGKRKGAIKTKNIMVDDLTKPKGKITPLGFTFQGYTKPDPKWKGKKVDFNDEPIYSVSGEVIEELGGRGISFLNEIANRAKIVKDLGTYYLTTDKSGKESGMLTCVNEKSYIHHKLNHSSTVTSRLSSSDPNLQNVSRPDFDKLLGRAKSVVKRMFVSRFGEDGMMTEADYSQLEVVVQGLLTQDKQLLADLKAGIDFHCKRLSAKEGLPYEEVVDYCKVQELPKWKVKRTKTKEFTFQRAFGAAVKSIAAKTGMSLEDVQKLAEAEEKLYPGITKYYNAVERAAALTVRPTDRREPYPDKPKVWVTVGKGQYMSPLKGLYSFFETPSYAWMRKKGIYTSLYRPHIQNYPIQGTAAQIVQYILGKLFRHFKENNNYDGKAFLVNTVHDCVWVDHHKSVAQAVRDDLRRIMESVPEVLWELHKIELNGLRFPVEVEQGYNMMELHDAYKETA